MAATIFAAIAPAQKVLFGKNNVAFLAGIIIAGQKLIGLRKAAHIVAHVAKIAVLEEREETCLPAGRGAGRGKFLYLKMEFKTVEVPAFFVVGATVRTTNANDQAQTDIGHMWERIFAEDFASKIPNKAIPDIYSIYLDYQSDYTAPYTYLLGFKVDSLAAIPDGFEGFTIPASNYHVYTAKGPIPACIHAVWKHVWHNENNRAYKADFEIFGSKGQNMADAELDIYIGVK